MTCPAWESFPCRIIFPLPLSDSNFSAWIWVQRIQNHYTEIKLKTMSVCNDLYLLHHHAASLDYISAFYVLGSISCISRIKEIWPNYFAYFLRYLHHLEFLIVGCFLVFPLLSPDIVAGMQGLDEKIGALLWNLGHQLNQKYLAGKWASFPLVSIKHQDFDSDEDENAFGEEWAAFPLLRTWKPKTSIWMKSYRSEMGRISVVLNARPTTSISKKKLERSEQSEPENPDIDLDETLEEMGSISPVLSPKTKEIDLDKNIHWKPKTLIWTLRLLVHWTRYLQDAVLLDFWEDDVIGTDSSISVSQPGKIHQEPSHLTLLNIGKMAIFCSIERSSSSETRFWDSKPAVAGALC